MGHDCDDDDCDTHIVRRLPYFLGPVKICHLAVEHVQTMPAKLHLSCNERQFHTFVGFGNECGACKTIRLDDYSVMDCRH